MGGTGRISRWWPCLILLLAGVLPAAAQIARLPHVGHDGDFFGAAVAIDGDRAVVGAPSEDACGDNSGAAYVFDRDVRTGLWHKAARLSEPSCRPGALFGRSVATTEGAVFIAAGGEFFAEDHGATIHVFVEQERDWLHETELRPPSGDAPGLFATTIDADAGRLLAVSSGDFAGGFHGAGYVFERLPDSGWSLSHEIRPAIMPRSATYGRVGAIRGDRIIIGAAGRRSGGGMVYIFEYDWTNETWLQRAMKRGLGMANLSMAISDSIAIVGEHGAMRGAGSARMFRREPGGAWTSLRTLRPTVTQQAGAFGSAVSLSADRALVVGFDEQLDVRTNIDQVVFVFQPGPDDEWLQRSVIDIGEVSFGAAVDFDGDFAIVGSVGDDKLGAAYIVRIH
jgi:hypothetical protein